MSLIDKTPLLFEDKSVKKLQKLVLEDKLDIFYTLKYPDSTWFYHNVIGLGAFTDWTFDKKRRFIKHLCENDLFYFCKYVLGKDKLRERPNREMCEKIMLRKHPDKQERKLLCEPRGTFKSTVASIGFPVFMICKHPDISIQIDSETDNQAKGIFKTVKDTMENNILLNELWGPFRDKDRTWNETEIIITKRKHIRRDPTLFHSGIDSSMNGYHPDICIIDDPHSEQNTQTEAQVDKVDDHYRLLTPLVDKCGEIILIGTRWIRDDLIGKILSREKDIWSTVSIKSCFDQYEDGTLYAQDIGLTEEVLLSFKKSMGMYRFSANYENNPKPDVDKSFKESWLQFFHTNDLLETQIDGSKREKKLSIYMAIDASWADKLSTGKDPTAIVVAGIGQDGTVYLLDLYNKRATPTEVIDQLFSMVYRWQPLSVASEDLNTQKGLNMQIDIEMKKRKMWFNLDRVKHQAMKKENRILSLTPLFENGEIMVREGMDEFVSQYLNFNPIHKIDHDDILDALEMLVTQYRDFYKHTDESDDDEFVEEYEQNFDLVTGRC
jgi:predicted phage terminase large subunit-like protein